MNPYSSIDIKTRHAIEVLHKAEPLAMRLNPEQGFLLAFSGGKDSQLLYHIARIAGVKFHAFMSLTSIDPPEVIRFVKRNYPDVELIPPKISIYDLALQNKCLPTRRRRWCCSEYKEFVDDRIGKVTLTGVRREESAKRRNRTELSVNTKNKMNFDYYDIETENMLACGSGKDHIVVSPILDFTEREVWKILNDNGIPHCELYDIGYHRIGCILCPMQNKKIARMDMQRYPHQVRKWVATMERMYQEGISSMDGETAFRWWVSKKSYTQFLNDEKFKLI